jgi:hypothetical protein
MLYTCIPEFCEAIANVSVILEENLELCKVEVTSLTYEECSGFGLKVTYREAATPRAHIIIPSMHDGP